MDTKLLKQQLDTLAVFRSLLDDPVIVALRNYLSAPSASRYATFASALYDANGGALDRHIETLCTESETVCTRFAAQDRMMPEHLYAALRQELQTLQTIADLTPEALHTSLHETIPLPGWTSGSRNIKTIYTAQLADLHRCGYGMYARHTMFFVDDNGQPVPVAHPDPIQLEDLVDYARERGLVLRNTQALLQGKPAANLLLTGDAGTGKSSTVKAVANALAPEGLRLVELRREQLRLLPALLGTLAENPMTFIVFIDDLSFLTDDDSFNALKAALEGSLTARSRNVCIYATSNCRHLIKERFTDREGDDVHFSDTVQEMRSLSDRFGLTITFSKPDKATYLHMVRALANDAGLEIPDAQLFAEAKRAALHRGGRSARLARQVVDALLCQTT